MVHEIFLSFQDSQHVTISIEKMSQKSTGAIASGVFGSGVFPVSLLLFLFANGMIAYEMVTVWRFTYSIDSLLLLSIYKGIRKET